MQTDGGGAISRLPKSFALQQVQAKPSMSEKPVAASGAAGPDGGDAPVKVGFWALTLGSIGVVYLSLIHI